MDIFLAERPTKIYVERLIEEAYFSADNPAISLAYLGHLYLNQLNASTDYLNSWTSWLCRRLVFLPGAYWIALKDSRSLDG